ncbi:MAG TPA: SDR family oxidoreductase [Rhizomicrobium sp.]|jgi:NAD(P)-dependent dehydrogenase (short-subunit alcohol dehydrogenase family)|nr:SDR family oxidoreductase [Rhizomicrobium sp.]
MTTILITGANRGIGLEFVTQYAAEGADIIACCREPAKAEALKAIKGKIRMMALDVSDAKSVAALKGDLKDTPIDILINNAGIGSRDSAKGLIDSDAWLKIFAVNSIAPVAVASALHDNLKAGHDKKLVTITSQLGSIANHGGGAFPYHASKAAVNSFMVGLAKAWAADGIAVGIFHPGWVQTDMGGSGAPVTPTQSVTGLRARIAELNAGNSGAFRDYAGKALPW